MGYRSTATECDPGSSSPSQVWPPIVSSALLKLFLQVDPEDGGVVLGHSPIMTLDPTRATRRLHQYELWMGRGPRTLMEGGMM